MKVERLYRLINGEKQPTLSVALFFKHDQEIPSEVDFRYKVYTVRSFIPSPVRCYACQRFGHIAKNCRSSKLRCPKCTGNHEFKDCGITARDSFKCGNCGGAHSAAHKGCPKFLEAKEVVKESAKCNITYAQALTRVRERAASHVRTQHPTHSITQTPIQNTVLRGLPQMQYTKQRTHTLASEQHIITQAL